jgi:outer membrane protein assembly factor BamB
LWSTKAGRSGRGVFEPLIDEQQVIVANRDGRIISLSRDSGIQRWRRELDVELTSGVGGSGEQIYVSDTDATVHTLDPATGEDIWRARTSSEIVVPVVAAYGVAIVRSTDGRIVALELDDGSERWSVSNPPPALSLSGYSRPLLLDGGVLVGLDDGRLLALNMTTGKVIWESVLSVPSGRSEIERLVDIDADLAVDDEGIYVANYQGRAARIEPSKGQVVWSVPLSIGSGIALDESSLIVVDENDTVQKLDKQNGQVLWSNETMTGRRLTAPEFTSQGDILVGDVEGYLHVLSAEDGSAIGRTRLTDEPIRSRPVKVDNVIYVQSVDGVVAAYRFAG